MPPDLGWPDEDEDDDWGSYRLYDTFRASCEAASRWDVYADYPEEMTQLVYPVEHGPSCTGHRRLLLTHEIHARRGDTTPWQMSMQDTRWMHVVPVSSDYL